LELANPTAKSRSGDRIIARGPGVFTDRTKMTASADTAGNPKYSAI
jgi:hypothetical protein